MILDTWVYVAGAVAIYVALVHAVISRVAPKWAGHPALYLAPIGMLLVWLGI